MRYAILSDIHANLEALQAVINHAEQNSIDQVICLGDLIGYGPNPNECIEFTQQKANVVIAGNHDHAPLGKVDTSYFNKYAKLAIDLDDSSAEAGLFGLSWAAHAFGIHL